MAGMFEQILTNPQLAAVADRLAPGTTVPLAGLWGSGGPLVAAALGRITGRCVLLLAGHIDAADNAADDVELFTGRAAQLLPAWEIDVGTNHLNEEITGERLRLANLLSQGGDRRDEPAEFIIASAMSLLQPLPSVEALRAGRLELAPGDERPIDELAGWLVDAGFERVEQIDQQGEFARRGGIVDVFPAGAAQPVRIELFGDQIESVRRFDLDTQRSTDLLASYTITGLSIGLEGDPAGLTDLLAYLPDEAIVCMLEPNETVELAEQLYARSRDIGGRIAESLRRPEDLLPGLSRFALVEMARFTQRRGGRASVAAADGPPEVDDAPPGEPVHFGMRSLERLAIGTHEALTELGELSDVADVWVYCENAAERQRFGELLGERHPKLARRVHTDIGHVHSGFHWPGQKLVAVGHHEVFRRYAKRRRIRRVRAGRPIESLLDLHEGEYVVHVAHGIALFDGLTLIARDGRSEEYLALKFAGETVLHVPASRIDLVQKYVGSRKLRPALSRLGGAAWNRQKQRAAEAVEDLAAEMIRVQAMRRTQQGNSYPPATEWQKQFADEFLYTETEDQLSTMRQLEEDLLAPRPMDRLLCGDVGYGKTELAMRAAFKVVEAGKQAAVLVPTTVLAAQHLRTFRERMADYPFEVEAISRFRTHAEQARICRRLREGRIDVLIGTHRLLSDDVKFADLALVIIDEEQRFGVEHKEHLKAMRASVDVLTMTATPIPRTLHMALLGLRDISSLTTPPLDRRAIHTEVCGYDDRLIRQAVLRELNRQGQVFFVHNRVYNIESMAEHVHGLVPEARVDFAHGQMKEGQLEKTMLRFVRQEIDVLVCTTIIESGLDIPTANTMIIHDADRFGLAALHQLRGRVGRYKHRAYCYLLLPRRRSVTTVAAKRLKAIEEFSDLGAGFQIAMRDLEIRGAGNILGREQSGHIAAVGYELYCRLLERAVRQLKGEPMPERLDVHIELGIDAYVPRSYIPSQRQRMEVYRRLVRCDDADAMGQLRDDLADAYGPVPEQMETLLEMAELRILAGRLGIRSIILMGPDLVFTVDDFAAAEGVFEGAAGTVRLPDDHTAHWRPPPAYREMPTLLRILLSRLRQAPSPV
jgi:transcription-repair coupling factor (superfamily II helicase)